MIPKEEEKQYKVSSRMADHMNRAAREFVPDKLLQEKIMDLHPVPTNFKEPPVLDAVTLSTLTTLKKTYTVQRDNTLRRAQSKIRDALGPFSRLWKKFEEANEGTVRLDFKEARTLLEQTAMLMGQSMVSLSHTRRKSVLANLTDEKSAKDLMKNNKEVFEREHSYTNDLLPEEFRDKLQDTHKAVGQVMRNLKFAKHGQPFQRGSHHSAPVGRGQYHNNVQRGRRGGANNAPQRGKISFITFTTPHTVSKTPSHSPNSKGDSPRISDTVQARGTVEVFLESVENHDQRSGDIKPHQGLGYPIHRDTNRNGLSKLVHSEGQSFSDRPRGLRDAGERGHSKDLLRKGSGPIQLIPSGKEGWLTETNIELEKVEPKHTIPPFQNGESEGCEKHHPEGGLDGKNRHEGCLFHSATESKLTKICQIQVEKPNIQIPLPVLRNRTGTEVVYKTSESADIIPAKAEHSTGHISGRHIDFRVVEGGNRDGKRLHSIPPGKPGIRNKSQEIRTEPITDHGIPGCDRGQSDHDYVIDREENNFSHKTLLRDPEKGLMFHKGAEQSIGEANIHFSSSHTMHAPGPTLTTIANTGTENKQVLWLNDNLKQKFQIRTLLVDRKSAPENRETHTDMPPRFDNLLRCGDIGGMGSILPGRKNRGPVDHTGKTTVWGQNKHARTNGGRFSNPHFCDSAPLSQEHTSHDRQQNSISLPSKNGRHDQRATYDENQIHLGISPLKGSEFNSGIPSDRSERGCRLRISPCPGLDRVETLPNSVSKGLPTIRTPRRRPVCIESIPPDPNLHEPKTRPTLHGSRRNATGLDPLLPLRIPPIQPHWESAKESTETPSRHDTNSTSLGNSTVVPNVTEHGNGLPITATKQKIPTSGPSREPPPSDNQQNTPAKCLDDLREKMAGGKISERVNTLLRESRAVGTRANYDSAWKKFDSWCNKREINPVHCPVSDILEFLAAIFDEGREHSTINGARSAISAYHAHVDNKPVGEHPLICALVKGVSNKRPPKPRYCSTWDINTVLRHIISMGQNTGLSHRDLSLKTVLLLAITSAHRGMELHLLTVNLINVHHKHTTFQFYKKHKKTKPGEKPKPSTFHGAPGNPLLCPCRTINDYISRSREWRIRDDSSKLFHPAQLFLSSKEPHQAVCKPTIAKWMVDMIRRAGVDVSTYKSHSTRGASTSKAASLGLPIDIIVKQGNWSDKSVFEKFYHKPIEEESRRFQETVLSLPE